MIFYTFGYLIIITNREFRIILGFIPPAVAVLSFLCYYFLYSVPEHHRARSVECSGLFRTVVHDKQWKHPFRKT